MEKRRSVVYVSRVHDRKLLLSWHVCTNVFLPKKLAWNAKNTLSYLKIYGNQKRVKKLLVVFF